MIPEFKFALNEGLGNEFLPTRAHEDDTGWDVRCAEPSGITLRPFDKAVIDIGFRCFSPPGWWLKLVPRSSTFTKKSLHCLYGTIDNGYVGAMKIAVQYIPERILGYEHYNYVPLIIGFGERIGQLIPVRREEMVVTGISVAELEELVATRGDSRKSGGFGSSGNT